MSRRLTINGGTVETDAPGMRRLIDLLREDLGLTGVKEGCGEGECGACTVILDGDPVLSCLVPVCQLDGADIRTVEGLAPPTGSLDTLQAAFLETGGAQCGICTPGMLMAAEAFLESGRRADRRGDPRGDRRQPLPLHRVHEDHRRHPAGRGARCGRRHRARVPGRWGRLMPPEPPVVSPGTLHEACELLAAQPHRVLAGGTDLLVQLTGELGPVPDRVLDLWRLDELRGIAVRDGVLELGALTTYTGIRRSADCRAHAGALVDAAATIGAAQIQNRGTIGGNVMNASPAGDTLPVLLALNAELVLASVAGERSVAAADFWPAYRRTARAPGRAAGTDPDPARRRSRAAVPQGRHAPRPGDLEGRGGRFVARGR